MYDFDFWYAYFDSIFLKPKLTPHVEFVKTLSISNFIKLEFPQCKKLPQLSNCFQAFQRFIYSPQTWVECDCQNPTLNQIEQHISTVALLINVEKKYGQEFWHSKRRIQASICHFFALLIYFLISLIPNNNIDTIENAKKSNKLCTSIKSLEGLVNKILPEINPILKFLYQESFQEQKKLTVLFLQTVRDVLMNLPSLNRKKFKYQFQLTRYLYVIIPIELSKNQYKFKPKRKKAITISNEVQMKYHSEETISSQGRKGSVQFDYYDTKRRSYSQSPSKQKDHFRTKIRRKNTQNAFSFVGSQLEKNSALDNNFFKLFQFSQKVRKHSFYLSKKKPTKTTFNSRQTLELKVQVEKIRKKSDFAKTSGSRSNEKDIGRSYSIQKQRILTMEGKTTTRSKKSSFYKIHRKTEIQQSQKHRHHKQKAILKEKHRKETPMHYVISKPYTQIFPLQIPTKKIEFKQGTMKGWGVIQDDLNKKIAKRKIDQLIRCVEIK